MNRWLVSASAAAVAAASMAASDITSVQSSNVVGYQLIPVPTGYTLFTPTFEGVGGATIDLTSIAVCDEDGNELDLYNDVNIQKMDDLGGYLDAYGYSPTFGGWNMDFAAIDAGDIVLTNGESVCVANDTGDAVYFKVCGQVDFVNKNEIGEGYVLWGNSTPVQIDLTEVSVVDAEGNELDLYNDVNIQKMDDLGGYLDAYGYSPTFGGWNVDFTPIEEGDVTLQPGEAVCVSNDSGDTVYFQLPHPIR